MKELKVHHRRYYIKSSIKKKKKNEIVSFYCKFSFFPLPGQSRE